MYDGGNGEVWTGLLITTVQSFAHGTHLLAAEACAVLDLLAMPGLSLDCVYDVRLVGSF